MGYDLHITRRKDWTDDGDDISHQEWIDYVQSDPELYFRNGTSPFMANWNGPSDLEEPWLCWSDGQIDTKSPDIRLIEKMIQVAEKLNAKVQGDDGETYPGSDTDRYWRHGSSWASEERKDRGLLFRFLNGIFNRR